MEISFGDNSFKGIRNSRGQGTVEYLLVLIVIVMMILGGVWQFNDAFRKWANAYFGDYIACLLETGEIPALGGDPGSAAICNALYKPFSLAEGRPRIPDAGAGSGSENSSSNSRGHREGAGGEGGGSGGTGQGSVGRWTPISKGSSSRGSGAGGKGSGSEDNPNTGSTAISSNGAGFRNNRIPIGNRMTLMDNNTLLDKESGKPKRTRVTTSSQNGPEARTNVRIPIVRKPAKAVEQIEDSPFTFSNFLRLLLIAAIIIALVVFLGGQLLQMSKASE